MNARILVADDEPLVLRTFSRLLQRFGFLVEGVTDGRSALRALDAGSYSVVLLDEQMPGLSGLETAQAIRTSSGQNAKIPIIMLTGAPGSAYRTRCEAAGINDCLGKPVSMGDLRAVLDRLCQAAPAEPPRSPAPSRLSFDPSLLLSVTQNKPSLFEEFCVLLRTRSGVLISDLKAAIAVRDAISVRRNAHQLRGMVLMIGANGLGAAIERIEAQAEPDASTAGLFEAVCTELGAVLERLDVMLCSLKGTALVSE